LLETVRELKSLGISLYFEDQNIDTATADGELMLSILASYAQEESLSNSENMKWRIHSNFQNGLAWNPTLLGYRYDHGSYTIEPKEAETVRLIFDSYLEGMGATAIAKMLTESTAVSRFGNGWGQRSIMQILQNYTYTGNLLLQKKYTMDFLTKTMKVNEGEVPQYYVEDSHPAIIKPAEWEAVQVEMEQRRSKGRCHDCGSPFSGKIFCGDCGSVYGSKTWHSTDKYRRVIWQCNHKYDSGEKCGTLHLREEDLKDLFVQALGQYMDDPDERLEGLQYV